MLPSSSVTLSFTECVVACQRFPYHRQRHVQCAPMLTQPQTSISLSLTCLRFTPPVFFPLLCGCRLSRAGSLLRLSQTASSGLLSCPAAPAWAVQAGLRWLDEHTEVLSVPPRSSVLNCGFCNVVLGIIVLTVAMKWHLKQVFVDFSILVLSIWMSCTWLSGVPWASISGENTPFSNNLLISKSV